MAELKWSGADGEFTSGGYVIRNLGQARDRESRWCLETIDVGASGAELGTRSVSFHPSLAAAQRQAARDERFRLRQARMSGHLLLGGSAMLLLVAVASFGNLAAFVAVVALMYVGLGSLADAFWIWMNGVWGTTEDRAGLAPQSWTDRFIVAVIERRHQRRRAATRIAGPVRALTPQPFEVRAARVLAGSLSRSSR